MVDMIELSHNGLRLIGPRKPRKNAYIRVGVEVIDDLGRDKLAAWNDAVNFTYLLYRRTPTEDGTIGQFSQLEGGMGQYKDLPVKGRQFSFGINLWSVPSRKLWANIEEVIKCGR